MPCTQPIAKKIKNEKAKQYIQWQIKGRREKAEENNATSDSLLTRNSKPPSIFARTHLHDFQSERATIPHNAMFLCHQYHYPELHLLITRIRDHVPLLNYIQNFTAVL